MACTGRALLLQSPCEPSRLSALANCRCALAASLSLLLRRLIGCARVHRRPFRRMGEPVSASASPHGPVATVTAAAIGSDQLGASCSGIPRVQAQRQQSPRVSKQLHHSARRCWSDINQSTGSAGKEPLRVRAAGSRVKEAESGGQKRTSTACR